MSKKLSIAGACIDYRFWPQALPLLREKYGDFDLIEIAGSCKNLTSPLEDEDKMTLLENIGISIRLHSPEKIILTNHIDCGAYGGSASFKSQMEETFFINKNWRRQEKSLTRSSLDYPWKQNFLCWTVIR